MKPPSFIVLADDLTGAAEIAAAGHVRGLSAVVLTENATDASPADLIVHDTNSRLLPAAEAARAVADIAGRFAVARAVQEGALLFKKTDSVLRGPVLAEIEALCAASGHRRALLVPANPALRRVVRGGRYFINEAPIHESIFRDDPHHPIRSSRVLDMLGTARRADVHVIAPRESLPDAGIIVGEASSTADLAHWAGVLGDATLPAGSTAFFESVLDARGFKRTERIIADRPSERVLVVSGTTAATTRPAVQTFVMPDDCATREVGIAETSLAHWTEVLANALAAHGHAVAVAPRVKLTDPDAPTRIRMAFAAMISRLRRNGSFDHVVIEGGATAAEIVRALGWNVLGVSGELAPGVATLRPLRDSMFSLTLKPGSYPWPTGWWQLLATRK